MLDKGEIVRVSRLYASTLSRFDVALPENAHTSRTERQTKQREEGCGALP